MTQDATIVRFPGDPQQLLPCYAEGLRRFAAAHPELRPEAIFLGKSDRDPNALTVILLWPNGVSHGILGGFLLPQLEELGLQRPNVEHLSIDRVGFGPISAA